MPMKPDYDRAAVAAMQMLIDNDISETPINPMPLLLAFPGVRVMPFALMANEASVERDHLIPAFGANQDACTFHLSIDIKGVKYVVVYNMRLPTEIIFRAIARELGHIVLGHDGATRPPEVRLAEAMCFAHHLLSPRPILNLVRESGTPLTLNVLANICGCIDECVYDMQMIPGVHVPAELNRKVRGLFERGVSEYLRFHNAPPHVDRSPLIDLGTFMDNYTE